MIPKYFNRGSATHVLLLIAKSEKKWFTLRQAAFITPLLAKPSTTKDAGNRLVKWGFLESKVDKAPGQAQMNYWRITPLGADYLRQFAIHWPSPYVVS